MAAPATTPPIRSLAVSTALLDSRSALHASEDDRVRTDVPPAPHRKRTARQPDQVLKALGWTGCLWAILASALSAAAAVADYWGSGWIRILVSLNLPVVAGLAAMSWGWYAASYGQRLAVGVNLGTGVPILLACLWRLERAGASPDASVELGRLLVAVVLHWGCGHIMLSDEAWVPGSGGLGPRAEGVHMAMLGIELVALGGLIMAVSSLSGRVVILPYGLILVGLGWAGTGLFKVAAGDGSRYRPIGVGRSEVS